jgi:hypothetical protein
VLPQIPDTHAGNRASSCVFDPLFVPRRDRDDRRDQAASSFRQTLQLEHRNASRLASTIPNPRSHDHLGHRGEVARHRKKRWGNREINERALRSGTERKQVWLSGIQSSAERVCGSQRNRLDLPPNQFALRSGRITPEIRRAERTKRAIRYDEIRFTDPSFDTNAYPFALATNHLHRCALPDLRELRRGIGR